MGNLPSSCPRRNLVTCRPATIVCLSGLLDPFAEPSGNARFLRIAAIHRYEFERRKLVEGGRSPTEE